MGTPRSSNAMNDLQMPTSASTTEKKKKKKKKFINLNKCITPRSRYVITHNVASTALTSRKRSMKMKLFRSHT